MELSVGQVAKRAEVAVSALHFYEQKGMILVGVIKGINDVTIVRC